MLVVDLNDKDNDDILNNNELQLPSESRNSFVMRADAQILSSTCSSARCPAHSVILRPAQPHPNPATCSGPGQCFVLCAQPAIVSRIAYNFWFQSLIRRLLNLIAEILWIVLGKFLQYSLLIIIAFIAWSKYHYSLRVLILFFLLQSISWDVSSGDNDYRIFYKNARQIS